jgi:hypothetical protein
MRTETSWSFISPTPLIFHDSKTNTDLCFWNGVGITRNYGRMLVGTLWCSIYYPITVKKAAWEEYKRAYLANAFLTTAWDGIIDNYDEVSFLTFIPRLICKKDQQFFSRLKDRYSPEEAFAWFEKKHLIDMSDPEEALANEQ